MRLFLLGILLVPSLAGQVHELCKSCHQDQFNDFQTHAHFAKGLSCDLCHGPSEKHRKAAGAAAPDRVAAPDELPVLCGGCHANEKQQYLESEHGKLVMARSRTRAAHCGTCHGVHAARTARQMRVQCDRCHASLPASHPKSDAACWSCHVPHTMKAKQP